MSVLANLSFDLGETWSITHTTCDNNGVPVNITGATVQLFVDTVGGAPLLSPAQTTVTFPNAANGVSNIVVTPAQQVAAGVTAQIGNYLIRVTLASGVVTDQNYGSFTIKPTIAH